MAKKASAFARIIRSLYLALNLACVGWLLICYWVSMRDVAHQGSIFSLFSFTTIFAAVLNVLFIFLWLVVRKRKWRALISLATLLVCWPIVKPLVGIHLFGSSKLPDDVPGIRIMTWNVHLFDLGEWTRDKAAQAKILKLIKDENPDILCLQEFYMDRNSNAEPYTSLIRQLGYPYFQFSRESYTSKRRLTISAGKEEVIEIGHAIFSKYPLSNAQRYPIAPRSYNMLSVDVSIDSVRAFNLNVVHLQSVRFQADDLNYIESVKRQGTAVEENTKSKTLAKKLFEAFAERAHQANIIDSIKAETHLPRVICGDFNDVPGSYVYRKILGDLSDPFVKKGFGLGRTYRFIVPTLRIDHIFYDPTFFKAESYKRVDVSLSDHLPVIADFSFVEQK